MRSAARSIRIIVLPMTKTFVIIAGEWGIPTVNKHVRRYLHEVHGHCVESVSRNDLMLYMSNPEANLGYIGETIESEFEGHEKQYLTEKLWDMQAKRRGWNL